MSDRFPEMSQELRKALHDHNKQVAEWRMRHPVTSETRLDGDPITAKNWVTTYYRDGKVIKIVCRERTIPYQPPLVGSWRYTYDPKAGRVEVEKLSD